MGYDIPNWLQLTRSSMYSCKELTNLELLCCELDPPPLTFKGFLFLKSLNLNRVELSPSGIESLVSICPLLERFVLIEFEVSELSISGPNLKYLVLSGDCRKICLYAPLLAEMSVEMSDSYFEAEYQQQNASLCTYTKLLGGLIDLEILSGSCDFTKYLSIGIESCHSSLVFHHLKLINLSHVDFRDAKEISVVVHLLVGAPNLHELIIRNDDRPNSEPPPHLSFMDFEFAHNIKLEKLRAITMSDVSGLPVEIEFLKFLLESSPGLEMMTIDTQTKIGSEEMQNLRDELLGCSFASLIVKLVFCSL